MGVLRTLWRMGIENKAFFIFKDIRFYYEFIGLRFFLFA